ncbi:hypothetical protein LINGRAPRIM_LOCUS1356 [Linum grandiflorum]
MIMIMITTIITK